MAEPGQAGSVTDGAEQRVARSLREGFTVTFNASEPAAEKTVTAAFLRNLLLGCVTDPSIAPVGVAIVGATITGNLSCVAFGSTAAPLPALDLSKCELAGKLDLTDSCFSSVTLTGCSMHGLKATWLNVGNGLRADDLSFTSSDSIVVDLQGLVAGGDVTIKNLGRSAPNLATCRLQLHHSRIGGSLFCDGAKLVKQFSDKIEDAALDLNGARIAGNVSLTESDHHRFESTGETRLLGAAIDGQLLCAGAFFRNTDGDALSMDRAAIGRSAFLDASKRYRFEAEGVVRLVGATIGGQLSCEGASFRNPKKDALLMLRACVGGSVLLRASEKYRFEAQGTIDLMGAKIGGRLSCLGARLEGAHAAALVLTGAEVADKVLLIEGKTDQFHADGPIRLQGARIGSSLECVGKFLSAREIFDFDNLSVGHSFKVRLDEESGGEVWLRGAHVGELDDDGGQGWGPRPLLPPPGPLSGVSLRLDGFVYDRLSSSAPSEPVAAEPPRRVPNEIWPRRIQWLGRQVFTLAPRRDDYFPQPHEQLAKVLRLMGHDYAARRVACHKSEHETACGMVSWPMSLLLWFYRRFFGAGYLPMRALATVLAFWLLGTGLICLARSMNDVDSVVLARSIAPVELVRWLGIPDMAPKSPTVEEPRDRKSGERTIYAPHDKVQARALPCAEIKAPLYALDLMVPFVGLHTADKCDMSEGAAWWWVYGKAIYEIIGWVIVAVAALTWAGVLRKDTA